MSLWSANLHTNTPSDDGCPYATACDTCTCLNRLNLIFGYKYIMSTRTFLLCNGPHSKSCLSLALFHITTTRYVELNQESRPLSRPRPVTCGFQSSCSSDSSAFCQSGHFRQQHCNAAYSRSNLRIFTLLVLCGCGILYRSSDVVLDLWKSVNFFVRSSQRRLLTRDSNRDSQLWSKFRLYPSSFGRWWDWYSVLWVCIRQVRYVDNMHWYSKCF